MQDRRTLRIEHPLAGRAFGVVWDLLVTVVSLLLIPTASLMLASALVDVSLMLMVLAAPFVALALFSLGFGVLWNFRRHMTPRC